MNAPEKVTLTLPHELMQEVRARSSARGQSKFVAEAVQYYIERRRLIELRDRLIAGYQANAEADAAMAAEWAPLEDEAWLEYVPPHNGEEPRHDAESR